MKSISFIGVMTLSLLHGLFAQMINGGFEQYDNTASDTYPYSINYAYGWKNLNNTCDFGHPNTAGVAITPTPRTGVGHARFGVPLNGMYEYFYGSTQPLSAGQTYVVSFWVRKDYATTQDIPVGLHIGEQVPAPQQLQPYVPTLIPQVRVTPAGTQWVRGYFCFTPQNSVKHYVTIGSFSSNTTSEQQLFLVDDVEVTLLTPGSTLPTATVSIPKPIYCLNETVTANGSSSTGGTAYQWSLAEVVNGNETILYTGSVTSGQPGTFSTASIPGFSPEANTCYRLYLEVFGDCKDKTSVDICFQQPDIAFLHDGQPVCEGGPVDLSVTGDNGWTYTWSDANGQLASGVGLKTVQVAPEIGNENYTVTVTTPEGCTLTRTYGFTVHTNNNVAPWMNGINGTGEYTYYVTAGDVVSFTSTLFNDSSNELILVSNQHTIPSGLDFTLPGTSGGTFSLSWTTHHLGTPPGNYTFTLTADDGNACEPGISTFTFTIVVICDQCPVCISYENRTPDGTPLPPLTKAGQCISAGMNQPVKTGTAGVRFQAGQFILLGPDFEAGPGFEALIEPTTCVTDCEDCCRDWAGFTYDEIPNPFFITFHDDDPTNDFIQVTDTYHPFCAFNAMGYEFNIMDRQGGNPINYNGTRSITTNYCCPFRSPAPENPIPRSSIWWDGHRNNLFGNPVQVSDGVYYYTLKLYGCGGQVEEKHGFIQVGGGPPGMATAPDELTGYASLSEQDRALLEQATAERERLEQNVALSPNPTTGTVHITGVEADDLAYQLFDDKGVMLTKKERVPEGVFSVEQYAAGTYYVRIFANGTYIVKKLIRQ